MTASAAVSGSASDIASAAPVHAATGPAQDWPEPGTLLHADGESDWLLICEHASCYMPPDFARLGLPEHVRRAHIAWDPGAADLTRALALRLNAQAVLANYSRLLIDLNRPLNEPSLIPERSEDIDIPGNSGLSPAERQIRIDRIHTPFHDRIAALIDQRRAEGRRTRILTVHSFTPVFLGRERPWHLGVLAGSSRDLAAAFLAEAQEAGPGLCLALDEPYAVGDGEDYAIPVHGDGRGLDALLLELRNDTLASAAGIEAWADLLAGVMNRV